MLHLHSGLYVSIETLKGWGRQIFRLELILKSNVICLIFVKCFYLITDTGGASISAGVLNILQILKTVDNEIHSFQGPLACQM